MSATVHTYGSCATFLSDQRVATFRRNMPTVPPAPVENASQGRIGGQRRHQKKARMANSCAATSSTFARSGPAPGRRSLRRCNPELRGRPGSGGPARTSRSEVHRPADLRRTGCSTDVPCRATGTDQDLLQLGHTICTPLCSGRSELGLINHPPGGVAVDRYRAGILIGISEAAFCPGISAPPGATRLIQLVPKTFDA